MPDADVIAFPEPSESPAEHVEPERPLREVVGEVLREERLDQQRTLADVASGAAVSLPYLSEIERGRKEVSSDLLAAVCAELGITLADVLDRSTARLRVDLAATARFQLRAA